jgi:hypothetical protein
MKTAVNCVLLCLVFVALCGCYSARDYTGDGRMVMSSGLFSSPIEVELEKVTFHGAFRKTYTISGLPPENEFTFSIEPTSNRVDIDKASLCVELIDTDSGERVGMTQGSLRMHSGAWIRAGTSGWDAIWAGELRAVLSGERTYSLAVEYSAPEDVQPFDGRVVMMRTGMAWP